MKPSIGRIVHFVQAKPLYHATGEGSTATVHLPAVIVAVWGPECVNLQVFTDMSNSEEQNGGTAPIPSNVKWMTSVGYDETATKPRSWHWPEREE